MASVAWTLHAVFQRGDELSVGKDLHGSSRDRNDRSRLPHAPFVHSSHLGIPVANGLTDLFKALHPEHRPFQELHDVVMWVGTSPSHGTASAHSANMAALAVVFTYRLRWWGTPWVVVAIITGFSRVSVGAHYPHQVLLGWICGLVAGGVITKAWDVIQAHRDKQNGSAADVNQPTTG